MIRREDGVDETTMATLKHASGAHTQVLLSQRLGVACDYVEVLGTAGRVRADWLPRMTLHVQSLALEAYKESTTIEFAGDPAYPMYVDELREFGAAIREGRDPAITAEDGLRVLEVIDAIVESGRTGQAMEMSHASQAAA
jgi:myo-inositol 2-dehydrogenase/D-chiro-inositol 1-dehydrogenase